MNVTKVLWILGRCQGWYVIPECHSPPHTSLRGRNVSPISPCGRRVSPEKHQSTDEPCLPKVLEIEWGSLRRSLCGFGASWGRGPNHWSTTAKQGMNEALEGWLWLLFWLLLVLLAWLFAGTGGTGSLFLLSARWKVIHSLGRRKSLHQHWVKRNTNEHNPLSGIYIHALCIKTRWSKGGDCWMLGTFFPSAGRVFFNSHDYMTALIVTLERLWHIEVPWVLTDIPYMMEEFLNSCPAVLSLGFIECFQGCHELELERRTLQRLSCRQLGKDGKIWTSLVTWWLVKHLRAVMQHM